MYSTDPDCSVLLLPFAVVSAVLDDGGSEFFITEASFSIINSSKVKYESTKEVPKKEARGGYGRQRRTPQEEVSSQEGLLWLPSEFEVSFDGTTCSINSYINSLHPKQHASLYKNISRCFTAVLPLFEAVLSDLGMGKHVNQSPLRVPIPTDGDNGTWYSGGAGLTLQLNMMRSFSMNPLMARNGTKMPVKLPKSAYTKPNKMQLQVSMLEELCTNPDFPVRSNHHQCLKENSLCVAVICK